MKLYISPGAVLLLAVVYAPLVAWLLWRLWRTLSLISGPVKLTITGVMVTIAAAIPLWDVVLTSVEMNRLCVHAGISVKKRVFVDGFLTPRGGAKYLLSRGFKFIETREPDNRIVLYAYENGELKASQHLSSRYEPKSRYEFVDEAIGEGVPGTHNIDSDRAVIRDRTSGEELGRSLKYRAYPGWVDRHTFARLGQILWRCPDGGPAQEIYLMHEVLLPVQQ